MQTRFTSFDHSLKEKLAKEDLAPVIEMMKKLATAEQLADYYGRTDQSIRLFRS